MVLPNSSRIGVVTTSYPASEDDYAGGFVAAHAQTLLQAGHHVDVIAAGAAARDICKSSATVTRIAGSAGVFASGGAPDALESGTVTRWLSAAAFSVRVAAAVVTHRRRWNAVIAHWLAPCGVAALSTRGPLLCVAHGGDVHLLSRTNLMTGVIGGLAARRAQLQFVSGHGQRQALEATHSAALRRYIERQSIVCAMGLKTAAFANLRGPQRAAQSRVHREILIVARLVPIKGIDIAIASLAHIVQPVKLTVAGHGPLLAELTAAAAKMMATHSQHSISFTGAVSPAQRNALLARCCMVAVPSRILANGRCEGTPQIAIEAMASGVPVVVSNTGGLADMPQSIRKFASGDPRSLATAMLATLESPPLATELQAAACIYDWTTVAAKMMSHWVSAA